MPVRRIKRSNRPRESRAGNTAIHHWIFPDVRGVIERDELMADHLYINSECNCPQSEQDEEIGSLQSFSVAEWGDTSFVPCSNESSFSLSRSLFGHSSRDYQRSDKRILAVAKRLKAFSCLSGISRELHEIAAGVTPSTLTRWFSSRFVRLNCRKYAQRASALQRPSCARH